MGCGAFACDDSGESTVKPRSSQPGNISNVSSNSEDGDGVPFQLRQQQWLFPTDKPTSRQDRKRRTAEKSQGQRLGGIYGLCQYAGNVV